MTNQVIPEAAATSAALEAGLATHDWEMFEAKVGDVAEAVEIAIRAALEAAAPHMLAEAWQAGEEAGQDNADSNRGHDIEHKRNPYEATP